MGKFIKDVVDLVEFLAGKNIATKQPPEKIDLVLYEISCSLFNGYIDHYAKTQKIARELEPFLRVKDLTLIGGKVDLPEDFQLLRYYEIDGADQCDFVLDPFWSKRKRSRVRPPSLRRPIARVEEQGTEPQSFAFEVFVGTETPAPATTRIYYFKTVNKPKYGYDPVGTRYVYNESTTIDLEWGQLLFPEIKLKALNSLGINLREQEVTQYTEMMKREEGLK